MLTTALTRCSFPSGSARPGPDAGEGDRKEGPGGQWFRADPGPGVRTEGRAYGVEPVRTNRDGATPNARLRPPAGCGDGRPGSSGGGSGLPCDEHRPGRSVPPEQQGGVDVGTVPADAEVQRGPGDPEDGTPTDLLSDPDPERAQAGE